MKKIYSILLFSFIPFLAMGVLTARYLVQREAATPRISVQKQDPAENEQITLLLIQTDDLQRSTPKLIEIDAMFVLLGEDPSIKTLKLFPSGKEDVDLLLMSQFTGRAKDNIGEGFYQTLKLAYDFSWDGTILYDGILIQKSLDWVSGIMSGTNSDASKTIIAAESDDRDPIDSLCAVAGSLSTIDLTSFPSETAITGHYLFSGDNSIYQELLSRLKTGANIADCEILPPG
jgi:hypothetical protein